MSDSPTLYESGVSRREFLSTTTIAGAGLVVGVPAVASLATEVQRVKVSNSSPRKRYAIVGVGSRSAMYRTAVLKTYAEYCQMAGFCDVNEGRLKLAQRKARQMSGAEVPIYTADNFDRMIRETSPDIVIVTTKDATHDGYIIRAMELG